MCYLVLFLPKGEYTVTMLSSGAILSLLFKIPPWDAALVLKWGTLSFPNVD